MDACVFSIAVGSRQSRAVPSHAWKVGKPLELTGLTAWRVSKTPVKRNSPVLDIGLSSGEYGCYQSCFHGCLRANHSFSLPKALVALVSGPKEAVSGRRVTLCHIRPHSVDPRHWQNGNSQDCEVAFLGVLLSPIIVLSDLIHLQL